MMIIITHCKLKSVPYYNLFIRRRASKAFYRSPKTTFLAHFTFQLETISQLIIKIALNLSGSAFSVIHQAGGGGGGGLRGPDAKNQG